jgi:hypothetical protein
VRVGVGVAPGTKSTTNHPTSAALEPVSARVIRRLVALVSASVNQPTPMLSSAVYAARPPRP